MAWAPGMRSARARWKQGPQAGEGKDMMSDVLWESIRAMQYYRAKYPEVYRDFQREIEEALAAMERLGKRLDAPVKEDGPNRWIQE